MKSPVLLLNLMLTTRNCTQLCIRLIMLLIISLLFLPGCNSREATSEVPTNETQSIQANTSSQPNVKEPFRDAVNKAMEAASLAQTAKNSEEWSKVADTWQQAIDLMKAVPESSTNYETAQQKAVEYQSNLQYAQRNSAEPTNVVQQPNQSTTQKLPISEQAAKLKIGMAYQEVITLLGRMPDTVVNDQIRQELGEPIQGNSLITFEWKNDDSDCQPVSVQFNPSTMTVSGWNEGKTCTGSSIFNEPFGKTCTETTLCEPR